MELNDRGSSPPAAAGESPSPPDKRESLERTIRRASVDDVPVILAFIRELAHYEKLSHEVFADEAALEATLFGDRPAADVLLCLNDGEPVGFALFFTNYSTFLAKPGIWLEDLFVRPAARGRGNGRALLEAVAREAVERDAGRLEWAVLDWNYPARGFYEKLGARALTDWIIHRVTGNELLALGIPAGAAANQSSR